MSGKFSRRLVPLFAVAAFGTVGVLGMRGCSDRDGAENTLEKMGYSDISYEGHPWVAFSGSKGDVYADEFTAVPPGGNQSVSVTVTRGWFKGATIRVNE